MRFTMLPHFAKQRLGKSAVKSLSRARVFANEIKDIAPRTAHDEELMRQLRKCAVSSIAMPYILEHLSSLRQEITDLRNMNARFTGKPSDTQIDQSAVEMRANRLAEIKKELSQMLNRPEDPKVWWEKGGRRKQVA